jgi:cytoplasmic iron level regulating protein YaaA (DUF328/UPF0246 family)
MTQFLFFLSPAKKMNLKIWQPPLVHTEPLDVKLSKQIISEIQKLDTAKLEKVMAAKGELLNEVKAMLNAWGKKDEIKWSAASLYNGDAYTRLDARNWSVEDWEFAQNHMVILSGLYGWLRPLDAIAPYRLMVGAPWKNKKGQTLYQIWNEQVQDQLENFKNHVGVICCSQEYAQMITFPNAIKFWITVDFKTNKNGEWVTVSSFSKQARGEMVKQAIQQKISNLADLKKLEVLGYKWSKELSSDQNWIYVK